MCMPVGVCVWGGGGGGAVGRREAEATLTKLFMPPPENESTLK